MTLPKEGYEKYGKYAESLTYEELKSLGDEYIDQCYNGSVSSVDDEIAAIYSIEVRRREKEMPLLELIKKRSSWFFSKSYKNLRKFWLQRRLNIIVCSPLLISLYVFGIEPTVTFIAYVLGNIFLLYILVFLPCKAFLWFTEDNENPVFKKIRRPLSKIGDWFNTQFNVRTMISSLV